MAINNSDADDETPAKYPTFSQPVITWFSPNCDGTAHAHSGNVVPARATDHIVTITVKLTMPTGSMIRPYPRPFQPAGSDMYERSI